MRFLLLLLLTGCCSKQIELIHKPLTIPTNCIFEKFTEDEKESMSENVGRKIYKNQITCKVRQKRIGDIIDAHNKAHGDNNVR